MTSIPNLAPEEFGRRLRTRLPESSVSPELEAALFAYFLELRRWARRIDLIGPGTADEVVERHFAESLEALPWIPETAARLADLGSGAGFPGLVLAAALPRLEVTLVEPRERRRLFLAAAARRIAATSGAPLRVRISDVRVTSVTLSELPDEIDVVTVRALRLDPPLWRAVASRLRPDASLIFWSGSEPPDLPDGFALERERLVAGSRGRILREYRFREPS